MTVIDLNPSLTKAGHRRDPLGVCAVCFSKLLRDLVDMYDREHPFTPGKHDQMLAGRKPREGWETNLGHNRQVICEAAGVPARRFQAFLSAEFATVSLCDADSILCAFGRTDLFVSLTPLLRDNHARFVAGVHVCGALPHVADFGATVRPEKTPAARRLAAVEPSCDGAVPASGRALTLTQTAA